MITKNKIVLGVQMLFVSLLGFARLSSAAGVENPIKVDSLEALIAKIITYALRKKIEDDPAQPEHVITETGVGYRFLF